ncbi:MAG: proline--tRNA ligase [Candidatus Pacebacteria bacterium]|nr:proline--tRNA ligase [Candidatus Paceibacterota bacterium]
MTKLFPRTRYGEVGTGMTEAHSFLLKAGFIKQLAPGSYILLPLGFRVWRQIQAIVWDVMESHDVQNLQLPILQPQELWQKTGRWDKYVAAKVLFETTERHTGAKFGLAPTAEEVVTQLAAETIDSYRDLPVIWHQIGWKFRDEIRPRHGLLRCREFDMSDAYSFDRDQASMQKSFDLFRLIYAEIFDRVGLTNCINVQADSGAIGGKGSSEFMAVSKEGGEDILLTCTTCSYGANAEKATSIVSAPTLQSTPSASMRLEYTPNTRTVEDLVKLFPNLDATRMVKTIILTADEELGPSQAYQVAVCIRGDLEINIIKLKNALGAQSVEPAKAEIVRAVTGADVGFAGPIGLQNVRTILFDHSVEGLINILCGGNKTDHHFLDVVPGRDFPAPERYFDLHLAVASHTCPECKMGLLQESRGIEVGHIFMLQTGYADKMDATFKGEDGKSHPLWMGCYGIGTTRLMQAIVEQNRDKDGIIWPKSVAPFQVEIVPVKYDSAEQKELAERIYRGLKGKGVSVLLDDRESLQGGAKFKDADLIGCPWRVIVGRKAKEGIVEVKNRRTREVVEMGIEDVFKKF